MKSSATSQPPDDDLFAHVPEGFTLPVPPSERRRRGEIRRHLEKEVRLPDKPAPPAPREASAPDPKPAPAPAVKHVPSAPFVPAPHLHPVCTAEEVRRFRAAVEAQLAADVRWTEERGQRG